MKECPICYKVLPSTKSLASHRRKVHKIVNPLVCCVVTRATITVEQLRTRDYRVCSASECEKLFVSTRGARFCGSSCAAKTSNLGRVRSTASRQKIAELLKEHYSEDLACVCIDCKSTFTAHSKSALRCSSCKDERAKHYSRDRKRVYVTNEIDGSVLVNGRTMYAKQCAFCNKPYHGTASQRFCSSKCCYDNSAKGKPFAGQKGGYRPRAGRGHYGYYDGIWCDSTWEMAYVWFCNRNGHSIKRNTTSFPYINHKGEPRKYIPDFIVNGSYVEVKGWIRPDDPLKFAAFPHELTVLTGQPIKDIVALAQQELGTTNLETLFSERPTATKRCLRCNNEFDVTTQRRKKYCNNSCAAKHQADIKRSMVPRSELASDSPP